MHTSESIHKNLVQPYFDNRSALWGTCGKLLKDKLERFQSRAARVTSDANYDTHSVECVSFIQFYHFLSRIEEISTIFLQKSPHIEVFGQNHVMQRLSKAFNVEYFIAIFLHANTQIYGFE